MTVKIQVSDNQTCNFLYDALILESGYNPNDRARSINEVHVYLMESEFERIEN
jgi:hypothetical protein